MTSRDNSINWFEISVENLSRAKKFYESILGIQMQEGDVAGTKMAFFPFENGSGKVAGALAQGPFHKPGIDGSKVYLNANPDITNVLQGIENAGGKVILPKTSIGPSGFMAFFVDSEGNVVGLHSSN
jgi:predicted enzyme related to lactoylglutathione lyase